MKKTVIYELDGRLRTLIDELFLELFNLNSEEVNLSIDFIFKCIKFKIIKEKIKIFIKLIIDGYDKRIYEIIKSLPVLSKMNNMKLVIHEKHDRFYIVKVLLNTHIDFLRNLIRKYINNNNDVLYIIDSKMNSIIAISRKEISIEVKTKRNYYTFNYFIENEFDKFKVIKSNKQNGFIFLLIEIEKDLNNKIDYTFEIEIRDIFKKALYYKPELLQVKLKNYKVIEASYNEKLNITNIAELLFESYSIKSFIDKINKDRDNFIENLIIDIIVNKNKIRSFIKEIKEMNMKVIEFIKNGGIYLID